MGSLRRVTFLVVMATCMTAHATERARVVLAYERSGTSANGCPDEATFRGLVAARLGYDPFVAGSPLALRVELRPRGKGITGSLRLTSDGAPKGDRSMSAGPGDCYELAASLALAAAVAVDPEGALRERATPGPGTAPAGESEPAPTRESASPPPPATPPAAPPSGMATSAPSKSPLGILLDAGAVLSVGMQPRPASGLRLGGSLHEGPWSIGVEAAAFLPGERDRGYGTVSATALYGSLVPCVHPGSARFTVDLCAVASMGALFSDARGVARARAVTDRYTTLGPRLGLTWMASETVGLAVSGEAPVALPRVHLLIDDGGVGREVWASSSVGFVGGASMVLKVR